MQFRGSNNVTEEAILSNDTRKQLDAAIQNLPVQQREIYILCQQDGLKYEEVAGKLNISVNTVKTHMKRALASVRTSMKPGIDLADIKFMKFIQLFRCNIPLVASKQLLHVMRIFILLMTVFLIQVSAATKAQQLTINGSNLSLREVITESRKQAGYTVLLIHHR